MYHSDSTSRDWKLHQTLPHSHTHKREEGHRDFSSSRYAQLASPRLREDGVCHEDRGNIWSAICFNNSSFLTS